MNMQDALKKAHVVPPPPQGTYFDEYGNLRLEFVARANIETLASNLARDRLNMHQLRRFFNYCREIERRLKSNQSSWDAEKSNVMRLSAFAADAAGKSKIPPSFRKFLDENVTRIHSKKDFVSGFMEHFEALVGFAALYLKEERR